MLMGQVTIGKAGKSVPGAKVETPESRRGSREKPDSPMEKPQDAAEDKTVAQVQAPAAPPPPPEVKTVEKPVATPPEPDPDAVQIKAPDKKEDIKEDKKEPKQEPKKPEAKKPPKKNELSDALASLNKQVGKPGDRQGKKGSAAKGGGSGKNLSGALDDLKKQAGSAGDGDSGSGPGGSGGDGIGILGSYRDSVVSRVRPNWTYVEGADRTNYTAEVQIRIAADGAIEGARFISESPSRLFNQSVLAAIEITKFLEPPPSPDLMDITIRFSVRDMRTQ